jgi:hypothetical protein
MTNQKVKVSDLQLGDVITTYDFPYNFMTVVKISPDEIEAVRPYITTTDFSTLDDIRGQSALGIIPYIGTENVILSRQHYSSDVTLVQRRHIRIL